MSEVIFKQLCICILSLAGDSLNRVVNPIHDYVCTNIKKKNKKKRTVKKDKKRLKKKKRQDEIVK